MKPIDIDQVLSLVTLRPGSDRWVYTQDPRVPEPLRGKPVPRCTTPDGTAVYFLCGTKYAVGYYYTPILAAAQGPDVTALDPMVVQQATSTIEITHKMSPASTWSTLRDRAMQETFQRLVERTGAEQFQVVPAVADLFEVSIAVVRRAIGAATPKAGGVSLVHKQDHRWRAVVAETQRAKSSAYGRDMVKAPGTPARYGQFRAEDLLVKHRGEKLFPERCPLLGVPLIYDRHSYPKDLRLIAIARRDTTKPLAGDNVVLVSRRGYKLLETRSKPETAEEIAALENWARNNTSF